MMTGEGFVFVAAFLICSTAASGLNGECLKNEQCGTFDTYCKSGTCVCKDNFVNLGDTCLEVANSAGPCKKPTECKNALGARSMCKNQVCVCKAFHHLYQNQCIKSRGLDDLCDSGEQCYCGNDCHDKIYCSDGICMCKPGFKQHSRRCIVDPDQQNTISVVQAQAAMPSLATELVASVFLPMISLEFLRIL